MSYAYDLSSLSIEDLVDHIGLNNFDVQMGDWCGHFAADILLEGSGDSRLSNGNAVHAYRSSVYGLVDSFATEVEIAEKGIYSALQEAYLHSANLEWLEYFGEHFGVYRSSYLRHSENTWKLLSEMSSDSVPGTWGYGDGLIDDGQYRMLIVNETIRPRSHPYAIAISVLEGVGQRCLVREPYVDVARFDDARSDDRYHLYDGSFWTWGVIQPIWTTHSKVSSVQKALALVDKSRPAGTVIVRQGETPPPTSVTLRGEWQGVSLQEEVSE